MLFNSEQWEKKRLGRWSGVWLNWLFRICLERASENAVNWMYQPETEKPARDLYVKVTKICLVTEDQRKGVCTRNAQNEKRQGLKNMP